ncbi:MAG TPA: hypothetical protein VI818_06255, partial [Candidatus Thermoplasmatota archaeon]|nr:hypothetical protein [Candidatus Thermoplasmatota archaeon]
MIIGLVGLVPLGAAQSAEDILGTTGTTSSQKDPDPQNVQEELDNLQKTGGGGLDGRGPAAPGNPTGTGGLDEIGGAVAAAVAENWAITSGVTVALLGFAFLGWALASRYV